MKISNSHPLAVIACLGLFAVHPAHGFVTNKFSAPNHKHGITRGIPDVGTNQPKVHCKAGVLLWNWVPSDSLPEVEVQCKAGGLLWNWVPSDSLPEVVYPNARGIIHVRPQLAWNALKSDHKDFVIKYNEAIRNFRQLPTPPKDTSIGDRHNDGLNQVDVKKLPKHLKKALNNVEKAYGDEWNSYNSSFAYADFSASDKLIMFGKAYDEWRAYYQRNNNPSNNTALGKLMIFGKAYDDFRAQHNVTRSHSKHSASSKVSPKDTNDVLARPLEEKKGLFHHNSTRSHSKHSASSKVSPKDTNDVLARPLEEKKGIFDRFRNRLQIGVLGTVYMYAGMILLQNGLVMLASAVKSPGTRKVFLSRLNSLFPLLNGAMAVSFSMVGLWLSTTSLRELLVVILEDFGLRKRDPSTLN